MLVKEALFLFTILSRLMAAKMEELIPHVQGRVNGQIFIGVGI